LNGQIQSTRGIYQVGGRKFIINEGLVTFTGLPYLDAHVHVKATCKIEQLAIFMLISGTLTHPQIAFQSDPPKEQADILASLFFGKSVDNLTQSEGIQLGEKAIGIIGGLVAKQLKNSLGTMLAPDVVEIKTGEEGGFEIGKYVSKGFFVTYERKFGIEEINQVKLEYQLTDYFSVKSQIGDEKTSGIDFFWTLKY
ncbi:MAG: translocation/assembly module TamB domain-containing protein, partial [Thermodesulfobacteriota bacterium]|nr:translocation/assembly module TamB domain-containing protein [Thermodesulfobacteriota bacterium]